MLLKRLLCLQAPKLELPTACAQILGWPSGIAPVQATKIASVPVGLGVDGSASNHSGNLALEARQAMLPQLLAYGASPMSPMAALEIATCGCPPTQTWRTARSSPIMMVGKSTSQKLEALRAR